MARGPVAAAVAGVPPSEQSGRIYEVFNPGYSVGVACDERGWIVGVHVGDEVWDETDRWLAAEIVRVARLAYAKAGVARRADLLADGASAQLADSLGLPTDADYRLMAQAEFGEGY